MIRRKLPLGMGNLPEFDREIAQLAKKHNTQAVLFYRGSRGEIVMLNARCSKESLSYALNGAKEHLPQLLRNLDAVMHDAEVLPH